MFILTAKLKRERLIAGAAAVAALCAVVAIAVGVISVQGGTVSASADQKGVKTNEDRVAYLESFGWTVEPEPLAVEELLIPEEFDETYTQYLELQGSQGFDLTQYCGKRVKRYTYVITNYPTGETGVQASLLIYKNTVIGGDVLSRQGGGFIPRREMPG